MTTPGVAHWVLLSGGLDSAANLALLVASGIARASEIRVLFVDYGQQAAGAERKAARAIASHFGIEFHEIPLPFLGKIGRNALTRPALESLPHLEESALDDLSTTRASAARVWVPNRNGLLIETAAALADAEIQAGEIDGVGPRAARVYVGFNREEAATFPDNSAAYLEAISGALRYSTSGGRVEVRCLTLAMDKREMVSALKREAPGFPMALVWSCYRAGDVPCWECESCRRFERATGGQRVR